MLMDGAGGGGCAPGDGCAPAGRSMGGVGGSGMSAGSGMRLIIRDIFTRSSGVMFLRTEDLTNSRKAFLSSPRSESVRAPSLSKSLLRANSIFSRCSGLSGESGPVSFARLDTSSVRSCGVKSTDAGVSQLMARARRKKMMLAMR
jgi:hypothetical protein